MPRYLIRRHSLYEWRVVAIDTRTARAGWIGDTVWSGVPSECPAYVRADCKDTDNLLGG